MSEQFTQENAPARAHQQRKQGLIKVFRTIINSKHLTDLGLDKDSKVHFVLKPLCYTADIAINARLEAQILHSSACEPEE